MDYTKFPMEKEEEKQTTRLPCSNYPFDDDDDDDYYYEDDEEDDYDGCLSTLSFVYLTINSIVAIFKAYDHEDYSMIAFVLFLYFGFMSLYWFSKVFERLRHEELRKKEFLKVVIWVLTTSLNLGLAIKFAPMIYPIAGVFVGVMAVATSFCGFYLFFIHKDGKHGGNKIKSSTNEYCDDQMKINHYYEDSTNIDLIV